MFTPEFIQQITLYSAFVISAVEGIKRLFKIKGFGAVLLSINISSCVCLSVLNQGWIPYIIYTVGTALSANGLFKAFHTPTSGSSDEQKTP